MLIAREKKKNNIAEYILYMWQLEDIIRSMNFDGERLYNSFYRNMKASSKLKEEMLIWYEELAKELKSLKNPDKGHVKDVSYILQELNLLHTTLVTVVQDVKYKKSLEKSMPSIEEIQNRSGNPGMTEVEACFTGVYGYYLLKLQKKTITKSTEVAVKTLIKLLAVLSENYKTMKSGNLGLPDIINN